MIADGNVIGLIARPISGAHQKQMPEKYARQNGFSRPTHFTDDGVSGTRFTVQDHDGGGRGGAYARKLPYQTMRQLPINL